MTLLIACILIYHFGLPWWLYLVAGAVAVIKAWFTIWMASNESDIMDRRFTALQAAITSFLSRGR